MKKLITLLLTALLAIVGCVGLMACKKDSAKYVAKAVVGAEDEQYGYCISKTSTNKTAILAAINEAIDETDMDAVVDYFTKVSNGETNIDNSLVFVDLSNNTAGTLEIYTSSGFEPYEFIGSDGTTVTGVDIYMMQLVAEKLNMQLHVNDVDFDGLVGAVATRDNAVGAAGISITDERKETVDFSDPYFSSVQYIISKESESFTEIASLAGKKIGVQKGTTGCMLITEAIESGVLKDTGASIVEYETGAVAFVAMKQGKCDNVVIDELPAKKLVG